MVTVLKAATIEDAMQEANEHLEGGFSFQFIYAYDSVDETKRGGKFEVRLAHEDKYAITLSTGKLVARRVRKETQRNPDGTFTYFFGELPENWQDWQHITPPDPMDALMNFLKKGKLMDD